MKVVYITSSTTMSGGGSKSFLNIVYGVIHYGVKPIIICPDKGAMYQALIEKGISVYACFYRTGTYPPFDKNWKDILLFIPRLFGRLLANAIGVLQLCKICKKEKPNIIHTNVSVTNIGYYASQILHIPHIWHIREYGDLDFNVHYFGGHKGQLQKYKKNNSYTICITKDLQKHNDLAKEKKSKVIYNGVLSLQNLLYTANKQPYFLFVGRVEEAKGVLPLLEAYISYCNKVEHPIPLRIAGQLKGDKYEQHCKELVYTQNLQSYVSFLGEISDILPLYQNAQAMVIPSISEGFGRITTEAMFSGCLTIGNDVAGTKEQFDNGKQLTGEEIGLRYTTLEQLVQHMSNITEAAQNGTFTQTYEPMILRAQKVVAQLYTTEQNAQQVYQFYQEICSRNS